MFGDGSSCRNCAFLEGAEDLGGSHGVERNPLHGF